VHLCLQWAERLLDGGSSEQWGENWVEDFGEGKVRCPQALRHAHPNTLARIVLPCQRGLPSMRLLRRVPASKYHQPSASRAEHAGRQTVGSCQAVASAWSAVAPSPDCRPVPAARAGLQEAGDVERGWRGAPLPAHVS